MGAALLSSGKVLSVGWNWHRKTHPKSRAGLKTLHAELHCIQGLTKEQLSNGELFVARITNGGLITMAKPCPGCQEMLSSLNLKAIFYTNRSGETESL